MPSMAGRWCSGAAAGAGVGVWSCALALALGAVCAAAATVCGECGKWKVPYPLSTSSGCGHPLYPVHCSKQGQLHLQALSGAYAVQSVDAASRTLVVHTAAFVVDSCITLDSVSSGGFALNSSGPFSVSPNNTVILMNASDTLLFTPLHCREASPCLQALTIFPQQSCRNLLCCSFSTLGSSFFKYTFPVKGQETAYTSLVNWVDGTPPASWTFGLQLAWDPPLEPPCLSQSQCGEFSTCLPRPSSPPNASAEHACLCLPGYLWNSFQGICVKEPFCVRRSGNLACHKSQYIAGLTVGLVGLLAVTALWAWACRKWRHTRRKRAKLVKERSMILAANSGGKSARLFGWREMKRATHGFARDRVLGCGGFGEVYKGILDDGSVVAIKSAKLGNVKGTEQVLNEVRVLSQVNHRNLVRLLGCCVDSELPLLVYEYVPNGNLFDHLHAGSESPLDWRSRLLIGFQAAEGLAYLHFAAYPPIYHRDVKSSNILLDKSMNARVSDFGISRLAEPDLSHVSTCAQGTLGYLDPEYYRNYQLTDKSDVYSFGVVLLELVTSRRAIDFGRCQDDVNLAVMVHSRNEEGRLDDVLDPILVQEAELAGATGAVLESMRAVLRLALACLSENRLDRPSMKDVAEDLQRSISSLPP